MDMKIDTTLLRQLRETRGWSQEHLAEAAGLSLRTVQRIEASGACSPESKLALAAALGIDAARLTAPETGAPAPESTIAPMSVADPVRRHRRFRQGWVSLCLGVFLLALDFSQHGHITWSRWPLAGMALAWLLRWARRRDLVA